MRRADRVAEIPGEFGPIVVREETLQKIWLRGAYYRRNLVMDDGRRLEVLDPGRWNRLEGPDFRNACLRMEGVEITGDVEMHIRSRDWELHGHWADVRYGGVVLHVVLFPDAGRERPAYRSDGSRLPTLVLLPHLHQSLEEHALENAVCRLVDVAGGALVEEFREMDNGLRHRRLREAHAIRWRTKVAFAGERIARSGWSDACHRAVLEGLGYRRNR